MKFSLPGRRGTQRKLHTSDAPVRNYNDHQNQTTDAYENDELRLRFKNKPSSSGGNDKASSLSTSSSAGRGLPHPPETSTPPLSPTLHNSDSDNSVGSDHLAPPPPFLSPHSSPEPTESTSAEDVDDRDAVYSRNSRPASSMCYEESQCSSNYESVRSNYDVAALNEVVR